MLPEVAERRREPAEVRDSRRFGSWLTTNRTSASRRVLVTASGAISSQKPHRWEPIQVGVLKTMASP